MRYSLSLCILLLSACFVPLEARDTAKVLRRAQEEPLDKLTFSSLTNTIIGGEAATAGEFPWFAVFSGGGPLCGGTLVHEDIVVTAAHCLENDKPPSVRVGATTTSNGNLVNVESTLTHPNYRGSDLENDIAILKLASPVNNKVAEFNTDASVPAGGASVIAMGFGRTSANGGGSSTLQKVTMSALSDAECSDVFDGYNSGFNVCADETNVGICFGDSGGPLVTEGGVLVGLSSFVVQDCASKFPDFFTRLSSYSTWLQRTICEQSDNPPDGCAETGDDDGPDNGGGGGGGGGGGDNSGLFESILACFSTIVEIITGGLGG